MDGSTARERQQGRRCFRAGPWVAVLLASCGARTGLEPVAGALFDVVQTDSRADVAIDVARDEAHPDAGRDVVADVPPRCTELITLVPQTPLLITTQGSFVTPRVVARGTGFDVLGPLSNSADPGGIRARRFTVSGSPATLSTGEVQIIGDGSYTWAEAASDGDLLGLCFAGSTSGGPQFRVWSDAYALQGSTAVRLPPSVATCVGTAWAGDRWVVAWTKADDSQPGPQIVEIERTGLMRGSARQALPGVDSGTAGLTSYANGAAWAIPLPAAMGGGFTVVFAPRGAADHPVHVAMTGQVHRVQLAPWPPDPTAIAALWNDGTENIRLAVIREDGTVPIARVVIPASSQPRRTTVITAFGDGVVIANLVCGTVATEPGRVDVHRFGADGMQRGGVVSVPLSCTAPLSLASVAASPTQIAVVWMDPRPTGGSETNIVGAVFGCAP